jgi:mRNA interferase MazF
VVDFPTQIPSGREQQGRRPAVVVALPNITGATRYSVIVIVPTTTQQGNWVRQNPTLYPRLQAGMGNLAYDSTVLIDQIRALDIRRVLAYRGNLTPEQYQPIEDGLKAMVRF